MQPISSRLQYFFKPRSWVLLINVESGIIENLQPLKTACKHWGGQLAFPPNWDELQMNSEWGSEEFWKRAIPGISLLNSRKQIIILSELLKGFDFQIASKLLSKKLGLSEDVFGYLLYFDENRRTFGRELISHETPTDWSNYVRESFLEHAFEVPSEIELDEETKSWLTQRESVAQIPYGIAQLIRDGLQHRNGLLEDSPEVELLSSAQRELPKLHLNLYDLSLEFHDLNINLKLAPLDFSIYYLYLMNPEGFRNKERFKHQEELKGYYRRFKSTDDRDRSNAVIDALFNPYDDKNFRDAVYRINKKIELLFDDPQYSFQFRITGERGQTRVVQYPRELLSES